MDNNEPFSAIFKHWIRLLPPGHISFLPYLFLLALGCTPIFVTLMNCINFKNHDNFWRDQVNPPYIRLLSTIWIVSYFILCRFSNLQLINIVLLGLFTITNG